MNISPRLRRAAVLLCAGILASVSHAQTRPRSAYQDGRLLERNLGITPSTRSSRNNDLSADIRLRNQIVTGNAPGGLSFRGSVGYRATGEFSGRLASDDLFAFRRDSLYSGLAGSGIRGTDAIQYQLAMTTGNSLPPKAFEFVQRGSVRRDGQPTPVGPENVNPGLAALPAAKPAKPADATATPPDAPSVPTPAPKPEATAPPVEFGSELLGTYGSLRSTSSYTATRGMQPVLLGWRVDERGTVQRLTASSLMGVQFQPYLDRTRRGEMVSASPTATVQRGNARPNDASVLVDPNAQPRGADGARPGVQGTPGTPGPGPGSPTDPLSGDKIGSASLPVGSPSMRLAFDDLRARISGLPAPPPDRTTPAPTTPDPTRPDWDAELARLRESLLQPMAPKPPGAKPTANTTPPTLDAAMLRRLRDSKVKAETYVTPPSTTTGRTGVSGPDVVLPEPTGDAFTDHMLAGQTYLAAGQYFNAEERFTRALSLKPGEANAMAARVNAQLGAGMFVSAASNLRTLLAAHPEAAALRFGPAALPPTKRLDDLMTILREQIAGNIIPDASGLMLAYLGHQREDFVAVLTGIAALERAPDPSSTNAVLLQLIRGVWIEDKR